MAAFKLPRLKANLRIVSNEGKPLDYFLRFWNIEVAPRIEQQETNQDVLIQQIQELQEAQAAQLVLIQEALELAGIAIGLAGGNTGVDTETIDIGAAWVSGPQVDLTGVVAGDVTIPGSGFIGSANARAPLGDSVGELRLVEIVSGVDTVIGGPWTFGASRYDSNPAGYVYFSNPSQIPTFTQARTTTGAVSYRIDARMTDGNLLTDCDLKLYARRTT